LFTATTALSFGLVTAATATVVVAAEQITQRSVFPHCVNKRDEHRRATTRKYALDAAACCACRNEKKYQYPKTAIRAALRKKVHDFPPVNCLQGGM
jgi:hypothetical protein